MLNYMVMISRFKLMCFLKDIIISINKQKQQIRDIMISIKSPFDIAIEIAKKSQ